MEPKKKNPATAPAPGLKAKKITDPQLAKQEDEPPFPIAAIGASAGGLEAIEQFFQHMPTDSGIGFVVIQHLDPTHAGIMPELLQRMTTMKVTQATDHLKVKPNGVYVIPPNKSMSILNGCLHLFEPVETRGLRLPIDLFFRSLANDRNEKSIGIILSGMGSDGTMGLKAIKEKNGMVMVQDPESARFDGMPRSAIESLIVDIVASAQELPGKLLSTFKVNKLMKTSFEIEQRTLSNIDKIILLIREQTGHDFSLYKKTTLFRRIERRKSIHEIDRINQYVRFLQENPAEIEILYKELLIGVTSFFRDAPVWEMLKETVMPGLLDRLPDGYVLRAWVPGCSTGEEAYTLAIIFREALEKMKKNKKIFLQIFATDLDFDAIEIARKGYYSKNIISDVSSARINKFFSLEGDGYRINTSIREMVVFAPHNVVKDPPFTKLDILTCRNMLIYMEAELQKKLMLLFNYSLHPEGIMVLGAAETVGSSFEGFIEVSGKLKIYKKSTTVAAPEFLDFPSSFRQSRGNIKVSEDPSKNIENIQTVAEQLLLQQFAPASVLVNTKGDIVYITGRTGKYLEPVAGKANWNIHVMAREGLRNELPAAFRKASQSTELIEIKNLKVGTNGGTQHVDVKIQRIENPLSIRGMIMIVFVDVNGNTDQEKDSVSAKVKRKKDSRDEEFRMVVQKNLEEIQSIREEMQTSQEELKSTNEELQSTNEELQSTNEELTTSKEEMQSLNEELQTVNAELQSKVSDLLNANDDMKNLLNSTEVATLFLDKDLNIRRFTDTVTRIFKLRSSDIGRPFTDLVNNLQYEGIDDDALDVLRSLVTKETAIHTKDERWFNIRIMPYRTTDDRIDGLVMTFNDITAYKRMEFELQAANEALQRTNSGQ